METCGRRWVAEVGLCPRCGQSADAHDSEPHLGTVVDVLPDGSTVVLPIEDDPETVEWRDADALGDSDQQYEMVLDREMGI